MIGRVLAVGTELLGDKTDANGPELARRLALRGVRVAERGVLPDDREAIAGALRRALAASDLVVALGGLGPTDDDVTREAACDVTGRELAEDPAARARIDALVASRGGVAPRGIHRQALVPEGAAVVANPHGLAPGAVLGTDAAVLVLLPGPPGELAPMIEPALDAALALLAARGVVAPEPPVSCTIVLAGVGESEAAARVAGLSALEACEVAWLAHPGEVRLVLRAREAAALEGAREAARAALGTAVVSWDGRALPDVLVAALVAREETIATGESCTGGLVAAAITGVAGSSAVFRRGFVTYADDAKSRLLGVPADTLREHGAVSDEVARAVASGARRAGESDWGVAVTGIAGPGGATPAKPVGLVHVAVACPDGRVESARHRFGGSRDDVRRRSVAAALDLLRRLILHP